MEDIKFYTVVDYVADQNTVAYDLVVFETREEAEEAHSSGQYDVRHTVVDEWQEWPETKTGRVYREESASQLGVS